VLLWAAQEDLAIDRHFENNLKFSNLQQNMLENHRLSSTRLRLRLPVDIITFSSIYIWKVRLFHILFYSAVLSHTRDKRLLSVSSIHHDIEQSKDILLVMYIYNH
jgi:hypothetical protein